MKDYTVEECLKNTVILNDCLVWKGSTRGQMNYAQFSHKVGKGSRSGHREVYLHFKGDIPKGYDIGHLCDNPLCINPNHLVLQTRKENLNQALKRGRMVSNLDKVVNGPGSEEFSKRVSEGVTKYWTNCSKEQRKFHSDQISKGRTHV